MTREQAKEFIKAQLESYLVGNGINTNKNFICLSPDHNESNPSMSYDRGRHKVHCFGCGADLDIFDIIAQDYQLDAAAAFQKAYELYNVDIDNDHAPKRKTAKLGFNDPLPEPPPILTSDLQPTDKSQEQIKALILKARQQLADDTDKLGNGYGYLLKRGLSAETIQRFNLGYAPEYKTKDPTSGEFTAFEVVIIPTGETSFTARNIDECTKENRIRKKGQAEIFNAAALDRKEPFVFVVEGEFDAMSVEECGYPCVGLGSTSKVKAFAEYCTKHKPASPLCISLDNDGAGQTASKELQVALKASGIEFIAANISGTHKDPNERLIFDRAGLTAALASAPALEFEQYRAADYYPAFMQEITDKSRLRRIKTGLSSLDIALDGGLKDGLYSVGALSSLGKTSLLLQIADNIAENGQPVFIFSLEMSKAELIAKSISRLSYQMAKTQEDKQNFAATSNRVLDMSRWNEYSLLAESHIDKALKWYFERYAPNIYISEGIGNIGVEEVKQTATRFKARTGVAPVVIIDYLQILAPYEIRATDKQNIDKAVLELKRLSRDLKTPVIVISSLNRDSYKERISMTSFKESGAIEYSSDVVIGLQLKGIDEVHTELQKREFDFEAAKAKVPREIELKILKNRSGKTGGKIQLLFWGAFNYFKEASGIAYSEFAQPPPPRTRNHKGGGA